MADLEPGFELLLAPGMTGKATRFMTALAQARPADCIVSRHIVGGAPRRRVLVLYGRGAQDRMALAARHLSRGGRVAAWDLGYWDRGDALRLAIDAWHPSGEQLDVSSMLPPRRDFVLREDAQADGPVMLVGVGVKSAYAHRLGAPGTWEQAKLAELRARFPDRRILWRPKGSARYALPGSDLCAAAPIEEALRGCSLVICRHSNVAVDACVAGVPVECEDGAARALYAGNPRPTREQRLRFLHALSWWNWRVHEAAHAWAWMRKETVQ